MKTVTWLAMAIAGLMLLSGSALAQPPAADADDDQAVEETTVQSSILGDAIGEPVIDEIVITGSRIRRDAYSDSLPLTVITNEQALLSGLDNVSEILQGSALASGVQIDNTFTGFVVSGGPGASTFGLRNLDAGRTLVLLNGRRFTAAGTRGQVSNVDLSSIPFIAVQRIEVLKDGASSVYGADAVAGVVNIITRRRFDDFIVEVDWQDDADYGAVSMLWGQTFDRGYIDFALETSKFGPVKRFERDFSACDERQLTNGELHPSLFAPTAGRCFGSINGYADVYGIARTPISLIPDNSGNLFGLGIPWRQATYGPDGGRIVETGFRDDRNWVDEDLLPQRELVQLYSDGLLDLDLGDVLGAASATYEFYFSRREDVFGGVHRQFFPFVHPNNPTNPFGVVGGVARPIVMSYDMLDPDTHVENDVTALNLGFDGDRGDFSWDVNVGYSWSRGGWSYDSWLKDKVARSLSSGVAPDGSLQCVFDPLQMYYASGSGFEDAVLSRILSEGLDPSCVPLDLFNARAIRGGVDRSAADYISEIQHLETDYDLLTATFNLEGRLFDMPAGEARGVLGLEWRSRELDDRPSMASVNDNQWGFTGAGRTQGDDRVSEVYGEVELPLLGGRPWVEELTLNTSYRWTDYSSYGDDTTWRALLNYAPNTTFRLRASLGTSFRAPAIYELFLANQTGFASASIDPCNNYRDPASDIDSGSERFKNCARLEEQGVIPPGYAATSSVNVITGGNLDLKAETSKSKTVGLVVTPDLADYIPVLGVDLSLAFDYYDIDLNNSISRLGAGTVLSRCYSSANFTAPECALIGDRTQSGDLSFVNSSFVNVAIEGSRGFDISLRTDREFGFGDLSFDVLATRVLGYEYGLTGDSDPFQYIGHHAYPKWRGEADLRFDWRDYTLTWSMDYVGSTDEEPVYELFSDRSVTNLHKADGTLYHTLSARFVDPNGRFVLVAGIINLLDDEPPRVGWAAWGPSATAPVNFNIPIGAGYDYLGRRLFASVSYSFTGP
ncbi:MAG: TonB-dependent receptor [Gammaproteobacteria bacterium]|nr:TonB-dependent receptor [Gammaproteobacteria bacterium]MYC59168.1 TonB-dependent receptor [Gammaproteobacteria bacterium]